jgi:hypothetical protein
MNASKQVPIGVWVFWISIAAAAAVWWFGQRLSNGNYAYLQTLVLFLTLIAMVWYTIETRRMQKAVAAQVKTLVQQTNLSIRPIFIAYIGEKRMRNEHDLAVDCLELENVGKGIALNITVDSVAVELEDDAAKATFPAPRLIFDAVLSIQPGERELVTHQSSTSDEETQPWRGHVDWMNRLKPPRAIRDYELLVRFADILGNRWIKTIHVGSSGSWPGVVEADPTQRLGYPTVALVMPFTHSPLAIITTKKRKEMWKPFR